MVKKNNQRKKTIILASVSILVIATIAVIVILLLTRQDGMRIIDSETGKNEIVSFKEQGQNCERFVVNAFKKNFVDYIEKGRNNDILSDELLDGLTKELDAKTFAKFIDYNLAYDEQNNTLTGEMEVGMVTKMSYLLGVTGTESGVSDVTCYYDTEGNTTKALSNGMFLYANGSQVEASKNE